MGRPRKVQPELQPVLGVSSPRWLILVSDVSGPRLFSAHCTEDAAATMRDSLDGLTEATVTMLEVPTTEGIMKAEPRDKPKPAPVVARAASEPAVAASAPAQPAPRPSRSAYRERTPEELELATMRALDAGGSQIISSAILDDAEPIS